LGQPVCGNFLIPLTSPAAEAEDEHCGGMTEEVIPPVNQIDGSSVGGSASRSFT
jgi:hypothetical protein